MSCPHQELFSCEACIKEACRASLIEEEKAGRKSPFERLREVQKERDDWKLLAERLAGALEFYGNRKNYESLDINRATGNSVYDILLHDFDRDLEPRKD